MKHKDNRIVVCLIGQVPYWMKKCRCDCVQTSRISKSWAGQGWQKFSRFVDNKPGSMTGSRVQNNEDFLCEEARTNISIPLTTTKVASRQPAAVAPTASWRCSISSSLDYSAIPEPIFRNKMRGVDIDTYAVCSNQAHKNKMVACLTKWI